jgi:hypothetical protein
MSGFSLTRPDKLPDPLPIAVVASLQGVSPVTVYASCHRFMAAAHNDDIEAMRHAIPCYMEGGGTDAAGNRKGGRIIIPRDAFLAYHRTATLGVATIKELYGDPPKHMTIEEFDAEIARLEKEITERQGGEAA